MSLKNSKSNCQERRLAEIVVIVQLNMHVKVNGAMFYSGIRCKINKKEFYI